MGKNGPIWRELPDQSPKTEVNALLII